MSTGVDKANARLIAAAPDDVAFLLARVRTLEAGLRKYGDHRRDCATRELIATDRANAILRGWLPPLTVVCDCGYAALAGGEPG